MTPSVKISRDPLWAILLIAGLADGDVIRLKAKVRAKDINAVMEADPFKSDELFAKGADWDRLEKLIEDDPAIVTSLSFSIEKLALSEIN